MYLCFAGGGNGPVYDLGNELFVLYELAFPCKSICSSLVFSISTYHEHYSMTESAESYELVIKDAEDFLTFL